MERSPLSFLYPPACAPVPTDPHSSHYPVHGATDPVPVYPREADSAERSETIKSTAESTLPCKLAHCQAQRFTVTCIVYISSTHTLYYYYWLSSFTIYREISHCCYIVLYILSRRITYTHMCTGTLQKSRKKCAPCVSHFLLLLAPTTHAYTHPRGLSRCHARTYTHVRRVVLAVVVVLSLCPPYAPILKSTSTRFYEQFSCEI